MTLLKIFMKKQIPYKNFFNLFVKRQKVPKKALIKNQNEKHKVINTHKNNVSLIYFPKKKIYRKFAKTKNSLEKIDSEYQGLKWYCKRINKNTSYIIEDHYKNNNFSFIDLNEKKGKKAKSWKSLQDNFTFLIKAFKHYIKFYPKTKKSQIHGDLTLDNIIFKKNNVFIIDWEYFSSKKSYRGYDIVYLFLSSVCLPHVFNKSFSKKDEKLFKILWKLLIKEKFNKKMIYNPFKFFENNIRKDVTLHKALKLSKFKFFPFITSKHHKKNIVEIIKSL